LLKHDDINKVSKDFDHRLLFLFSRFI